MSERRKFTPGERMAVFTRYNGRCAICGRTVKFTKSTIDHKIPLTKGGTNGKGNLQLTCLRCNRMKSDCTPEGFMENIAEIAAYNWKSFLPAFSRSVLWTLKGGAA